jgi:5-methylcytosine-specific restriction endonuclease McrA
MSQRRSRGHRHGGTAVGLTGPATGPAQTLPLLAVETRPPSNQASIWGRRRVLLLNSTYEPLTALPMRRAVIMLMCGKADVVHDDPSGPVIHSATRTIVVPSVIRLRSFVRVPYRARVPMTRAALMHRDRFRCAYCGAKADTVDHVVPQPRRRALVGELRGRVRDVQPPQGRPHARRTGLDPAVGAAAAQGAALAASVVGQGTRPRLGAIPG